MQATRLTGSRRAIGEGHGLAHARLIHRSLEVYDRLFLDFAGIRWAEARREAAPFREMIERGFPAILEEIDGIAEGAGVEPDDILTLNCRSEISLTRASGGCSAFALAREGTQWLAQNWDWRADQLDNVVVLEIHGDDAAPLVSVGEAGMVAKIGMNARGIGVCLNAIRSRTCGRGLPIHVALRKILEQANLEAAVTVASRDRVCSPAHFLVAGTPVAGSPMTESPMAEGGAVGLEVHPGEPGRLWPEDGRVSHTNHLVDRTVTCRVEDFPRPDSRPRLARLDRLLRERLPAEGPIDEDALFALLADHDGAPSSICRHADPAQPPEERMETLFSVVMDLTGRRLTLRHGKPCESEECLEIRLGGD